MFAAYRTPAAAYRHLAVETALTDANPHRMIEMLYDGAVESVARARSALASRDIPGRGAAISKAIRIIDEGLKASLDARGGEIARNLRDLYVYMTHRLLEANLNADDEALQEVGRLLDTLRDGWKGIAPKR